MRFETKIDGLLPKEWTDFNVRFFEMTREMDGGWSVNDSWIGQSSGSREEAITLLKHRWGVFKVNYEPKARVKDIEDATGIEGEEVNLECNGTYFAEVREGGAK